MKILEFECRQCNDGPCLYIAIDEKPIMCPVSLQKDSKWKLTDQKQLNRNMFKG